MFRQHKGVILRCNGKTSLLIGLEFVRKGGLRWAGWWNIGYYTGVVVQDLERDAGIKVFSL